MSKKVQHDLTAIIYDKRGRILSIGKNSYVKSHPIQAYHAKRHGLDDKIFLHAEIDAIIRCKDISKAHKISIFRPLRAGGYGIAKPCKICAEAIKDTPITVIEHT